MIDIKLIKENPEEIIRRYAVKGKEARTEITKILELDAQRRALISETEALKAEKNHVYGHLDYTSEYPVDINDVQYDYTPSVSYSKTVEKPAEISVTPVPAYKPAAQPERVQPEPEPVVQPEPAPAPVVKETPARKPQKEEE